MTCRLCGRSCREDRCDEHKGNLMPCSRCGEPCYGTICDRCRQGVLQVIRPRTGSLLPPKKSQIQGSPYSQGRPVLTNTSYEVSDGGNNGIYEQMLALKTAIDVVADEITGLNPEPPIDLIRKLRAMAADLELEVLKRRGT